MGAGTDSVESSGARWTGPAARAGRAATAAVLILASFAYACSGIADTAPPAPSCLDPARWTLLDGEQPRTGPGTALLAEMAKRDVVLLGERHDEPDDHRWQLQVLAALHAQRPDMVIGFEMFPRRVQPVLDDWVAGKLTAAQLLERSDWATVWRLPAELYLPLFEFARINRIPMAALNIDRELSRAISEKGWDAVPDAAREGVGRAAPASPAYRDYLREIYGQHPAVHARAGAKDGAKAEPESDAAFGRFVESQTAWDRAMAEALARRLKPGAGGEKPLVVGIMGGGHVRYGFGVPHQLRDLGVKAIGTLLPVDAGFDCKELRPELADAVFALPEAPQAKPPPPRLGVRLEQKEGAVRIVSVTAGSLAEATGLKAGDQIVDVAGVPASGMARGDLRGPPAARGHVAAAAGEARRRYAGAGGQVPPEAMTGGPAPRPRRARVAGVGVAAVLALVALRSRSPRSPRRRRTVPRRHRSSSTSRSTRRRANSRRSRGSRRRPENSASSCTNPCASPPRRPAARRCASFPRDAAARCVAGRCRFPPPRTNCGWSTAARCRNWTAGSTRAA